MGKILRAFFQKKGSVVMTVLLVILGIGMVIALPFLFVFALRLLGLGVEYSLGSWFGSPTAVAAVTQRFLRWRST